MYLKIGMLEKEVEQSLRLALESESFIDKQISNKVVKLRILHCIACRRLKIPRLAKKLNIKFN